MINAGGNAGPGVDEPKNPGEVAPHEGVDYSPIHIFNNADDWCIKSSNIERIPKFQGLLNENPHSHLKKLHDHCRVLMPFLNQLD